MYLQRLAPQICHSPTYLHLALPCCPSESSFDHTTWDYPPLSSGCRNGACLNPLSTNPPSHVILAPRPKRLLS
ncbi:mCG146859 [Mus musculus]|nr:mCG146859 [Mus musculus]